MTFVRKQTKKALALIFTTSLGLLPLSALEAADGTPIILTSESGPGATIVIEQDAPELTRAAAEKLAHYIEKISGTRLSVVHTAEDSQTESIIWVGAHQELAKRHAGLDFSVALPEESLIQSAGKDIIILGRDKVGEDGMQLEAATNLAVSSFIEEQLGVRWLWPGELGTDIPKNRKIQIEPLSIRYTPQVHLRRFNMTNYRRLYNSLNSKSKKGASRASREEMAQVISAEWAREKDRETREWLNNHRNDAPPTGARANAIAGSMADYRNRHAFREWYERYGAEHPEWFALQPDGTRTPYPTKEDVKMCISNPGVAEQWVKNAKKFFEENPYTTTFESGENDQGWQGYCVCKECLAWDNKKAEMLEQNLRWKGKSEPSYALTDRYAKFWNIIAKKLKEEIPDRDVNVATYAYHPTRPAPTIKLEPNIIPAFVGIERRFYSLNSQANTLDQRRIWKEWWQTVGQREALVWRPNMMARSMGLPYIFTKRHAENMRFMADHGLVGVSFNSTTSYWATEGPQLYLVAKLLWKPKADAQEILDDYYKRAFGAAAPHMASYFQVYEDVFSRLAEEYGKYGYSVLSDPPRLFRESRPGSQKATGRLGQEGVKRNLEIEKKAEAYLKEATAAVAEGDPVYRKRVEFMKVGFAYTQAQLDSIEAMNAFIKSGTDENRKRAEEAAARRLTILRENVDSYALNYLQSLILFDKHPEYLGPPEKADPNLDRKKEEEKLTQDLEA